MSHIKFFSLIVLIFINSSLRASLVEETANSEQKTLRNIKSQALSGNSKAQIVLGQLYLHGEHGVEKDFDKAMLWLEKAASDERSDLQEHIGEIYYYGWFSKPDYKKALYWLEKAANNGQASSADLLGLYHVWQLAGIELDCGKALKWFEKAVSLGYDDSNSNIVWLLSTCEDEKYRDGHRALKLGKKVLKNKENQTPGNYDNLAAAYAELGKFKKAIKIQKQAIALLDESSESKRYKKFLLRLEMYQKGQKWRGSSNSPESE